MGAPTMSIKHPIIAITGSSGAGTSSVKRTFDQIFRREKINPVYIEGDAFHRWTRLEMRERMKEAAAKGDNHYSHFGPDGNLFEELEKSFADYAASGAGQTRTMSMTRTRPNCTAHRREPSRPGASSSRAPICCSTKACMAAS